MYHLIRRPTHKNHAHAINSHTQFIFASIKKNIHLDFPFCHLNQFKWAVFFFLSFFFSLDSFFLLCPIQCFLCVRHSRRESLTKFLVLLLFRFGFKIIQIKYTTVSLSFSYLTEFKLEPLEIHIARASLDAYALYPIANRRPKKNIVHSNTMDIGC